MKVYQYTHVATGGHPAYVQEIAHSITSQGVKAQVLGPTSSSAAHHGVVSGADTSKSGVARVLNRIWIYWRQARQLANWLGQQGLSSGDVIHLQSLPSIGAWRFVRRISRASAATCVITVHNLRPHADGRLGAGLVHRSHRRAWKAADLLIVHTDTQAAELQQQVDEVPVVAVPHPVWSVNRVEREEDEEVRDFLAFGVLRRNKGLHALLDALVELGDPTCTVVGSGPPDFVAELRRAIAHRNLGNCLLDARFVDDEEVPRLFAQHRVCVLPYEQFDAQSGVLNLAIAHLRPSVVTDVGALGETVRQYGVGVVVKDSLADAMSACRSSASEFQGPLAVAADSLSPTRVGAQLVAAYASINPVNSGP